MNLQVRRTDPPVITSDTVAVITDAFVPLVGWRDVPVKKEVRDELTSLERFVLEMALKLGVVTADDFDEVVSLPQQVLAAGATRLVAGGALHLVGDRYEVVSDVAARALAERGIRRLLPNTADFVLLPRTGDLFAMPAGKKTWLRQLETTRLVPAGNAPVPPNLWLQRRSEYLASRLRAGDVMLLDSGIADVANVEDDPPLVAPTGREGAKLCPSYRCRAEVTVGDGGLPVVRAELHGKARKRKAAGDAADETRVVPIRLTGAENLVGEWLALTGALEQASVLADAWRAVVPGNAGVPAPASRRGPVEWDFPLDWRTAQAVAGRMQRLDQQAGLAVESHTATAALVCRFVPGDDEARGLFAIDTAVGGLLTSAEPSAAATAICTQAAAEHGVPAAQVDRRAVHHRAWDLGYHRLVYALREAEDFPYD